LPVCLPACLSAHLPTFILYVSFTTYPYTNYTVYRFYEDSWWVYVCVGEGVSYILLKLYNIFHSIFIISFTKTIYILLKLYYIFYSNLIIYFTQTLLYILLKLYYIFYSNFIVRNHVTAMSVSNFTIVEHYLYCILFFIYIVHTTRFKFKGCTRYANLFLIVHVKAKMNRKL
jgi:hypothetical protein